jgi:hypothetical protein
MIHSLSSSFFFFFFLTHFISSSSSINFSLHLFYSSLCHESNFHLQTFLLWDSLFGVAAETPFAGVGCIFCRVLFAASLFSPCCRRRCCLPLRPVYKVTVPFAAIVYHSPRWPLSLLKHSHSRINSSIETICFTDRLSNLS